MNLIRLFTLRVLKGISQIMLQENAWTGLLFVAGLFVGSYTFAIIALFGAAIGTLTAMVIRIDSKEINRGLYGFNSALVAVALLLFFKANLILIFVIAFAAAMATLLHYIFCRFRIPAFTLSFVLVAWLFIFVLKFSGLVSPSIITTVDEWPEFYYAPLRGFGQVIFQSHPIAAVLFILGIFINSFRAGIYSVIAAFISLGMALFFSYPENQIELGLYSYNAILCAIVFAHKGWKNILFGVVAVILSVFITQAIFSLNLIALTFPFVLATWIAMALMQIKSPSQKNKMAISN